MFTAHSKFYGLGITTMFTRVIVGKVSSKCGIRFVATLYYIKNISFLEIVILVRAWYYMMLDVEM